MPRYEIVFVFYLRERVSLKHVRHSKDQSILLVWYMILRYHAVFLFKEPSVSNIHTGDEGFFCMNVFWEYELKCNIVHIIGKKALSDYCRLSNVILETTRCAVQLHWFEFTGKCLESATRERWPGLPFVFLFRFIL